MGSDDQCTDGDEGGGNRPRDRDRYREDQKVEYRRVNYGKEDGGGDHKRRGRSSGKEEDGRTRRSRSKSRSPNRNRDDDRGRVRSGSEVIHTYGEISRRGREEERNRDRDRDSGRDDDRDRDRDDRSRRQSDRERSSRRRGGDRGGSDDESDSSRQDDRKRRRGKKQSSRGDDRRRKRGRDGRRGGKKGSRRRKDKRRRRRRSSLSSSSSSSSSGSSDDDSSGDGRNSPAKGELKDCDHKSTKKVMNARLVEKLAARGETLDEREERRSRRREEKIRERFGYTGDDNPFNDPNLHDTFSWKKKNEKMGGAAGGGGLVRLTATAAGGAGPVAIDRRDRQENIFEEIDKVRKRRHDRELHFEEVERERAEESRLKEREKFDEWARKEEEFHLQQQRQRSAIRLVEGRERPVDVLAKNLLLFGLTEEEKTNRAKVKYQEKYNALDELEMIEAELDEPHMLLRDLKLEELKDLLQDVDVFRRLEREAAVAAAREKNKSAPTRDEEGANPVLRYWDALHLVTVDEIEYLKTGGKGGTHASVVQDIHGMFEGQPAPALLKMRGEIKAKVQGSAEVSAKFEQDGGVVDTEYWQMVLDQLSVYLARCELSEIHSRMLVRQLEKLEKKKEDLGRAAAAVGEAAEEDKAAKEERPDEDKAQDAFAPGGAEPNFGNLEEELGLSTEVDLSSATYAWQDRFRPRKPRYFNRVKTGYDWNKYNQTHYDHDNPPPKTVQGYKFNIFYPDLIDKIKTPKFILEQADTGEFCILRFTAGPPYEDVAFKVINREWNRSRKRGYRCVFERGVLSLYFNFASHWYRR